MADAKLEILAVLKDKASGPFAALKQKAGGLGPIIQKSAMVGGAALVGLGALAVKSGMDIQSSVNTIKVGTGATGEALEGLVDDWKAVSRSVPGNIKDVAGALADLNTRLNLSGEPLQHMTKQFVDLSRITKTDLSGNIETITRTFGDWGVATENQSEALDKLFSVSQKTGPPVKKIGELMVMYGAPLRQMGFSFDEAAAMMGKFEKEGVNTQLVMGSLRIGLVNMAKAGEDPTEAFGRIVDEIKNMSSTADANLRAIELFGSRAGPDMAAAIREGRFEIEELAASLGDSQGAIARTSEDTMTFGDKLSRLKNSIIIAAEPLLTKLIGGLEKLADWITEHSPEIEQFVVNVGLFFEDAAEALKPFFDAFITGVETILPPLKKLAQFIIDNKPLLVAAITAVGVAIVVAFGPGAVAIAAIVGLITAIGWISEHWEELLDYLKGGVQKVKDFFLEIPNWLKNHWQEILITVIGGIPALLIYKFRDKIAEFWQNTLLPWFTSAIPDWLKGNWKDILVGVVGGIPILLMYEFRDKLKDAIIEISSSLEQKGQSIADWVWEGLKSFVDFAGRMIDDFIDAAIDWVENKAGDLANIGGSILNKVSFGLFGSPHYKTWYWGIEMAEELVMGLQYGFNNTTPVTRALVKRWVDTARAIFELGGFEAAAKYIYQLNTYLLARGDDKAVEAMQTLCNSLRTEAIDESGEAGEAGASSLASAIVSKTQSSISYVGSNVANALRSAMASFSGEASEWGRGIAGYIMSGIYHGFAQDWKSWAESIADIIYDELMDALDASSPAKKLIPVGVAAGEGYKLGFDASMRVPMLPSTPLIPTGVSSTSHSYSHGGVTITGPVTIVTPDPDDFIEKLERLERARQERGIE